MKLKGPYSSCHVLGEGELLNSNNKKIQFKIVNLSALEAEILADDEIILDKEYPVKIEFSSNILSNSIDITARVNVRLSKSEYLYQIEFKDLSEIQKIELDEFIMKTCMVSNKSTLEKCDDNGCILHKFN